MYAVLGIWRVGGSRDDHIEGLRGNVIPFIHTLAGFRDARFASDAASGRNYSYLTFETEADARHFIDVTAVQRRPVQQEHDVQLEQEFVLLDVLLETTAESGITV